MLNVQEIQLNFFIQIVERIRQEQLAIELIQTQRAERHLYTQVYIASDASFLSNTGSRFIPFDENEPVPTHPVVQTKNALKTQTLRQMLIQYAEECGAKPEYFRLWNLANRKNGNVQLDCLFADADLDLCRR